VIIGMTGSGKTGLGINIFKEAAIDKIPSIIIDPKGDNDPDTFTSLLNSTVKGLLALVNIEVDPLTSKEYMLLSTIFFYFWKKRKNLTLEELIGYITNPPSKELMLVLLKQARAYGVGVGLLLKIRWILIIKGFPISEVGF